MCVCFEVIPLGKRQLLQVLYPSKVAKGGRVNVDSFHADSLPLLTVSLLRPTLFTRRDCVCGTSSRRPAITLCVGHFFQLPDKLKYLFRHIACRVPVIQKRLAVSRLLGDREGPEHAHGFSGGEKSAHFHTITGMISSFVSLISYPIITVCE